MLPRTLLSTLSPRHIEQVVKHEHIPAEAVVAMVFFYIMKKDIAEHDFEVNSFGHTYYAHFVSSR